MFYFHFDNLKNLPWLITIEYDGSFPTELIYLLIYILIPTLEDMVIDNGAFMKLMNLEVKPRCKLFI